ncbi:MAG: hypothetical protein IPG67_18035 [Acidobacteria bacterium]|nr:hypothetical protein [Acidobacteriota bacterium]
MVMVNDPPTTDENPNLFRRKSTNIPTDGPTNTKRPPAAVPPAYYSFRTNESAGYGWNVPHIGSGNWRYEIARTANDKTPFLKVKSWMTNEAASGRMLKLAGLNIEQLRGNGETRFQAGKDRGSTSKLNLKSEFKTFDSPNVAGMFQGSDSS